jgi:hypothetical protein
MKCRPSRASNTANPRDDDPIEELKDLLKVSGRMKIPRRH